MRGEDAKIFEGQKSHLRYHEQCSQTEPRLRSYAYHPPEYEDESAQKPGRSFGSLVYVLRCPGPCSSGRESRMLNERNLKPARTTIGSGPEAITICLFKNNMPVVQKWMDSRTHNKTIQTQTSSFSWMQPRKASSRSSVFLESRNRSISLYAISLKRTRP